MTGWTFELPTKAGIYEVRFQDSRPYVVNIHWVKAAGCLGFINQSHLYTLLGRRYTRREGWQFRWVGETPKGETPAPRAGWCCSCGSGPKNIETPCPKREDKIHCEHWWDGPRK